ncbi:ATP-binding cassette domain-containing protein [Mycoplasmatota bacterium]|nr:ATP-binding cassette domain-containing protein [Mycoplasmatota bacterium]
MLELKNVSKSFQDKKVFDKFKLTVDKNDFITIIGSNGAGKSTLLNLISGELSVDQGVISLNGDDITHLKAYKKAKKMSRVFQKPLLGTSPSLTIIENLSIILAKRTGFGLRYAVKKKNIDYFKSLLKPLNLGLENQLNTKVGLLSGGQKQALSLIMATLSKPQLLLLDEHTAALDPETAKIILELTKNLVEKQEITTLMITHNLNDAITYGNRLIMLDKGKALLDIHGKEKQSLTSNDLLNLFKQAKSNISSETFFS